MKTYTIPFSYPQDISAVYVANLLKWHNINIEAQTSWSPLPGEYLITGRMDDLVSFSCMLDGPGQSFPIDEFKEFVKQYQIV